MLSDDSDSPLSVLVSDVQFCAKLLIFHHARRLEKTRAISGSGRAEFFSSRGLAFFCFINAVSLRLSHSRYRSRSLILTVSLRLSRVSSACCDRDTRRCSLFGTTLSLRVALQTDTR